MSSLWEDVPATVVLFVCFQQKEFFLNILISYCIITEVSCLERESEWESGSVKQPFPFGICLFHIQGESHGGSCGGRPVALWAASDQMVGLTWDFHIRKLLCLWAAFSNIRLSVINLFCSLSALCFVLFSQKIGTPNSGKRRTTVIYCASLIQYIPLNPVLSLKGELFCGADRGSSPR